MRFRRTPKLLRFAAFLPAIFLGAWLVGYTQRQAARSPTVAFNHQLDQLILGARREAAENTAAEPGPDSGNAARGGFVAKGAGTFPHVIRVTSKRIEMPIFDTRRVAATQTTPWLGDTVAAASDRKRIEPWLGDLIDRLSRNSGGKPPRH